MAPTTSAVIQRIESARAAHPAGRRWVLALSIVGLVTTGCDSGNSIAGHPTTIVSASASASSPATPTSSSSFPSPTTSSAAAPSVSDAPNPRRSLVPYRGARFSVSLPGKPTASSRQVPTAAGTVVLHFLEVDQGTARAYIVAYATYPRDASLNLDGAVRGAAASAGGRAADVEKIRYRGVAGRDFRVAGVPDRTVFQRILISDRRLYELAIAVSGKRRSPPAEYRRMVNSLRFKR